MNAVDDISTYREIADRAYARKPPDAINPKAVNAAREKAAGLTPPDPEPSAPAASGPKFTKGFSPAERAAQAEKLKAKLKQTGDN